MSEPYDQAYLEELTSFADRTGEVPPGLDDDLATALLIRIGHGDQVVRRHGDPRNLYDRFPRQLQDLSSDGLLDKPVRVKLDNGRHVVIDPPKVQRSHGSYADKRDLLENAKQNEGSIPASVSPHDQAWIAMALCLEENTPRDFRDAWNRLDLVERLLVVEERQEAPGKFVKRPRRGRPRKHPDSKIAARIRERNRRAQMRRERSAARKAGPLVAMLRELYHEAEDEGMTQNLWEQFDTVIANLENCMSSVQKPRIRNNLKRAA